MRLKELQVTVIPFLFWVNLFGWFIFLLSARSIAASIYSKESTYQNLLSNKNPIQHKHKILYINTILKKKCYYKMCIHLVAKSDHAQKNPTLLLN